MHRTSRQWAHGTLVFLLAAIGSLAFGSPAAMAMADPQKPLALPADGLVVGGSQLVTAGGAVGVGTATPSALLDVSGPAAGETVDQQQTFASGSRGGITSVWQSLTPGSDGALTRLEIRVGNSLGAWTATLNIYEGEGTGGALLASLPVKATGNTWHSFALATPIQVRAGQRYTWQLAQCFGCSISMTSSNPYSYGRNDYLSYSDYLFKTYLIPTRKVVVTSEGRLGVGTTAPDLPLTVAGSGRVAGNLAVGAGVDVQGGVRAQGGADLRGVTGGTGLHVDTGGNVGVGTAAPASRLDVHGPAQLRGSPDTSGLVVNSEGKVGVGTTAPGAALTVVGGATISGDVGIGTASPTRRLDVSGAARVAGTFDVTGNANVSGSLGVTESITVRAVKPVLIKRLENIGNDAMINTGVSATDYQCVAAGWSVAYDVQENNSSVNMVWTFVSGATWWLRAQFGSHSDSHENPDVDLLCFHVGISTFEGNRSLNDPD